MNILYFGIYDPQYARNRVLIKGLREIGVNVLEINDRSKRPFNFLRILLKYYWKRPKYDAMIVGFPGQESMLLARLLTRKPIILDLFTSHFGGYILDRKKHSPDSWHAKWYHWVDKKSVQLADTSLLDTQAHIDFFTNEFGVSGGKLRKIWVGTDLNVFYPKNVKKDTDKFLVYFQGNYIPLQGVEYIIRAAKILEKEDISFNLLGRGQTYRRDRDLAEELGVKNINFIDRVSYEKLADYINMADVSLGVFGNTLKTNLVIPNKIFEAIACGKPVITASTSAARELLEDRKNILFCRQADPQDLADKILQLRDNHTLRRSIGRGGYETIQAKCQEKVLAEQLVKIIKELL